MKVKTGLRQGQPAWPMVGDFVSLETLNLPQTCEVLEVDWPARRCLLLLRLRRWKTGRVQEVRKWKPMTALSPSKVKR